MTRVCATVLLALVLGAAGCSKGIPVIDGGGDGDGDGDSDASNPFIDAYFGRPDAAPGTEVCDGEDNDGDQFIDEGTDVELCGEIDNGTPRCNGTLGCEIVACDTGYFDVDQIFDNGCECGQEVRENGGTDCSGAVDLGDLADTNNAVDVIGNVVPIGDVDVYRIRAVDTADTSCDNFHVRAQFLDNPGDAYVFDVWRGSCTGAPFCDAKTDMQWYTNYLVGNVGECPCGPEGVNHCDDDTAEFFVKVYRKDGMPLTCTNYRLELSNGKYPAP